DSPEASYNASAVWPKGSSASVNFLRQIINEEFGEKNSLQDIGKIFLASKKKMFDTYLEENKDVEDSLLKDYPSSYNMEESQQVMIAFHTTKLLTLADLYYAYTGGAHGNYNTNYVSLDLMTNKKLKL